MRVLRWAASLWIGVLSIIVLLAGLLLAARLLLPFISSAPALLRAEPADGASAVLPRGRVVLQFSTPMNRLSVERALHVEPPIVGSLAWSDDGATLTLSPTQSLRADTTYHITLGDGARSRMFRAFEQPIDLSFRTAPAPAALALLPLMARRTWRSTRRSAFVSAARSCQPPHWRCRASCLSCASIRR